MGSNAIHAAAEVLPRLAAHETGSVTVDGLDYQESLSAVNISGGVAGNVVPDECRVSVNYRFAPNKSAAEAEEFLREFFTGFDDVVTDAAEGARPGLDRPIAQEFIDTLGLSPAPKLGWTDVSRFSSLGVPAVNFGPGNPLFAHKSDEHVSVAEVVRAARTLRSYLEGRCGRWPTKESALRPHHAASTGRGRCVCAVTRCRRRRRISVCSTAVRGPPGRTRIRGGGCASRPSSSRASARRPRSAPPCASPAPPACTPPLRSTP